MFSPTKKLDKELLLEIGECIITLSKINTQEAIDLAQSLGLNYQAMEYKISTKDYSYGDSLYDELYGHLK